MPVPGVPVVVGADAGSTVKTTVLARALIGIHLEAFECMEIGAQVSVPAPVDAVEVLGTDSDRRLVVSAQDAFLIVDVESGAVLAIQALARSQPAFAMMPGMPEKRTHDYVGTGPPACSRRSTRPTARLSPACTAPPGQ